MTFDVDIFNTVLKAKCVAACRAEAIINQSKGGEDVRCCELKLILLTKWIEILQNYYCDNFNSNGNITPAFTGISQDEAQELLSKLKTFIK